jgi:hypothetical protein
MLSDALVSVFVASLGRGREAPTPGPELAKQLGISERTVRALRGEAIRRGYLVGSICNEPAGYFLCRDREDLEVGIGHILSRARTMFAEVACLRRTAERHLGPEALTLFDLDTEPAPRFHHDEGLVGDDATRRITAGLT